MGAGKQRALLAAPAPELRRGRLHGALDRRALGGTPARERRQQRPRLRLAAPQGARATGTWRRTGTGTCSRSSRSSSTSAGSSACTPRVESSSPTASSARSGGSPERTRALARTPAFGLRVRAVRAGRDRPPRGAAPAAPRGADRGRPRPRPPRRARLRARGARPRASAAGASARAADARPLPLGPPGGGARCVPAGAQDCWQRSSASSPAGALQELEARDPETGRAARSARGNLSPSAPDLGAEAAS